VALRRPSKLLQEAAKSSSTAFFELFLDFDFDDTDLDRGDVMLDDVGVFTASEDLRLSTRHGETGT